MKIKQKHISPTNGMSVVVSWVDKINREKTKRKDKHFKEGKLEIFNLERYTNNRIRIMVVEAKISMAYLEAKIPIALIPPCGLNDTFNLLIERKVSPLANQIPTTTQLHENFSFNFTIKRVFFLLLLFIMATIKSQINDDMLLNFTFETFIFVFDANTCWKSICQSIYVWWIMLPTH